MTHSETAAKLVLGDRNDAYGTPKDDFDATALMWSGLLQPILKPGEQLTATHVALMMTALKLRRHTHSPKADNLIDAHGYLLCLEWIETGVAPRIGS